MSVTYLRLVFILPIQFHPDLSTSTRYKISLRSDHPFVSYKYLIFSNFSELLPSPNSNKESGSGLIMSVTYLGLILPTKFHPDLSALSVFQDFRPPPHPITLDPVGISNKRSEFRGPSKYEISLRYDHSFVSQKYLNFSNF